MTQLVVDASFVVRACGNQAGFKTLGRRRLAAPPLMWSEARSALHQGMWRGEVTRELSERAHGRLATCPVERVDPLELHAEAWRVADELGWAKTYDAEYVALARILSCRLVTLDARLHRGASRLGFVIAPHEL